jgi:hypothetical protein
MGEMTTSRRWAYPGSVTRPGEHPALRRVRYAADAAYADGLSEEEILAAVRAGIANAKATIALFAESVDDSSRQAA